MLIPLGNNCVISWMNELVGIQQKTTPFEWFYSMKLSYITEIITRIEKSEIIDFSRIHYVPEVSKHDVHTYLLSSEKKMFSSHYRAIEFASIFPRRYSRMIEEIKNNDILFFVRFNNSYPQTLKVELENFIDCIHQINTKAVINFLLIDLGKKNTIILDKKLTNFYHEILPPDLFNYPVSREMILNNTRLQKIYMEMLEKIGYNK